MARIATLGIAVWLFLTGVEVPSLAHAAVPQYLVALGILLAEVLALRVEAARWASFALGLWLAAAPLALGYPVELWALDSFAAGLAVAVLASRATLGATYGEPPTLQRQLFARQGAGKAIR